MSRPIIRLNHKHPAVYWFSGNSMDSYGCFCTDVKDYVSSCAFVTIDAEHT